MVDGTPTPARLWPVGGALLLGVVVALIADRRAPWPAADVSRGGEDAFVHGLHARELPPGGRPLRWTGERARVAFRHLPPGPATLAVRVRGHRGPVTVAADGVLLGVLAPRTTDGRWELPATGSRTRVVDLLVEPFVAGGRRLGTQLERVELSHARGGLPAAALVLAFVLPAVLVAAAALATGVGSWAALLLAALVTIAEALLLCPQGLLRSDYALKLAFLLCAGTGGALLFARYVERRHVGAGRWAYAALLPAILIQGVSASSPLMVVSDAVFHGNNLVRVAQGQWLLTSVTQHAHPFRFPYGVSFYAPLIPLWQAGFEPVALVRGAAALSAVAASGALFMIAVPAGAGEAALAVALWQLLPGTFDVFSYGNLSNVFGQAVTVGFVAWWLRGRRWPVGALLLAIGCLAHFSSLVVLFVLAVLLLVVDSGAPRRAARVGAVAGGLGLAAAYYALFLPLMLQQLPMLGQGSGAVGGPGEAVVRQLRGVAAQWGIPAVALAALGLVAGRRMSPMLRAWWLSGLLLAVVAIVSPIEVRYLYAVGPALAIAAAAGAGWLWARPRGRFLALPLVIAQGVVASRNALEALLWRYRP